MATTYITVEDATTYFQTRLDSDVWFDEPEPASGEADRKLQSLYTATRMIDQLAFRGTKTDADQDNQFPRNGDTEVPQNIQLATAELAYSLLDGMDPALEYEITDMTSQSYSNIRSTYDRTTKPEHIVAGIPSIMAWRYLIPYLVNPEKLRMDRVS